MKQPMVTYLLILGCLTAGLVFQVLGFPTAQAPVLSVLGFVLVAIGLGAYAKVKGQAIGVALLAALPVLGHCSALHFLCPSRRRRSSCSMP